MTSINLTLIAASFAACFIIPAVYVWSHSPERARRLMVKRHLRAADKARRLRRAGRGA